MESKCGCHKYNFIKYMVDLLYALSKCSMHSWVLETNLWIKAHSNENPLFHLSHMDSYLWIKANSNENPLFPSSHKAAVISQAHSGLIMMQDAIKQLLCSDVGLYNEINCLATGGVSRLGHSYDPCDKPAVSRTEPDQNPSWSCQPRLDYV